MPGLDCDANALTPVRATEWHGFVFLNVSGDAPDLAQHIGNLNTFVADHEPERLVQGAGIDYDVRANWKLAQENYQECYHCSNIHPELCAVTPPESGVDFGPTGVWVGGSMDLRPHAQTMSFTGESGAAPLRGLDDKMRRRVLYFGLFPNLLISLHPDYVMTHRIVPLATDRTIIECRWFFAPEEVARDGFDPSYAVEFWDLTNRQDWEAIESVQRGVSSRGYRQGPLSVREDGVRQFDTIVAQGYLTGRLHRPIRDGALAEASLGS
jgi:Rieske 2Fe-2S family protein